MNGVAILLVAFVALVIAYLVYGRWLARKWGIDPTIPTPAHNHRDNVDYVPSRRGVVFGHQFASIAGAGPINGPIIASGFGWLPVFLWIILGGVFIGAVHDFASLYASVKSQGRTIGYIIELYIGRTGKQLFLSFVWLFSILVIAAFADIVALTFNGLGEGGILFSANASVASTSIFFVIAAVGLGFFLNRRQALAGWNGTILAISLLVLCVLLGLLYPIYAGRETWLYAIFIYIFLASVTPIWILLQPRDYLNSFLLVFMILAAFIGIIIANPPMLLPAFTGFSVGGNYIFPFLFVAVACGAVSGFHSLVASGTTSKQINNEVDILPISFGGMLLECLLAVIALIAVGAVAVNGIPPNQSPPVVFANSLASFLTGIGLPHDTVFTLVTLAVSSFALTSLDSVARVGRIAFQEFFFSSRLNRSTPVLGNRYVATLLTLAVGFLLARRGYRDIWPLFGSANQLLAALALLACAVFLKKSRRNGRMLYIPMLVMLLVTLSALSLSFLAILDKITGGTFSFANDGLQFIFAILLFALGVVVAGVGLRKLRQPA
ncbi:MAG: carbon starvation protein A [Planctomycetota bacterium]|jgi:carbon starvation protein|nr:carbon starvation protein A [Planctomycetota bacterium]